MLLLQSFGSHLCRGSEILIQSEMRNDMQTASFPRRPNLQNSPADTSDIVAYNPEGEGIEGL